MAKIYYVKRLLNGLYQYLQHSLACQVLFLMKFFNIGVVSKEKLFLSTKMITYFVEIDNIFYILYPTTRL